MSSLDVWVSSKVYNKGDCENHLNNRHSYHTLQLPKVGKSKAFSKSDLNFTAPQPPAASGSSGDTYSTVAAAGSPHMATSGEYYKKYEHDEVPVKDSNNTILEQKKTLKKISFTNSDLENLEKRIYNNVSQELQTEDGSLSSLESNIKFFKTTVEKIFETFYTSMRDYELYKARFQEILLKSKEGSIDDMEDFIKDMFEHIMSSENSASKISNVSTEMAMAECNGVQACVSSSGDSGMITDSATGLVEAYKNEHYLTDSTLEDNSSQAKRLLKIEDKFNILLLSASPCVEIKLNGRNLVSEINVKQPTETFKTESIASADNLKKIRAKKLELENFIGQHYDTNMAIDRDIPVKVSYAKKNIYLDEDFTSINGNSDASKSLLSKLCNMLCRKFRKSSFI